MDPRDEDGIEAAADKADVSREDEDSIRSLAAEQKTVRPYAENYGRELSWHASGGAHA